ncbi:ketopantoate reductase family protein [Aeromicrobium sp. Leaf350]|uniref:ketopantoate reductase family protein n=1 Tax=Aeromicrobium sp. Leaf350 TaxID=2876565 RepID=UPI001E5328D5|nr:2-dehydropantoate 2-reductase [Aeromicrobium sp. Leaf350]
MSRILVVGLGAIGGYAAAVLAAGGADVSVLARGRTLDAVRAGGLRITGGPDEVTAHPVVLDRLDDSGTFDVVLVATKAHDTADAVAAAADHLAEDGVVVALQNGVGRGAAVSDLLGRDAGLDGVVYLEARMEEPGVVSFLSGARRFELGDPTHGADERAEPLAQLLRDAGLNAVASPDPHTAAWKKMVLVSTANSMTGATRAMFGDLIADDAGRAVAQALLAEGAAVAAADGADLGTDFATEAFDFLVDVGPSLRSSMLHDVERGRRTEVDALNGEVVRRGEALGVATPSHRVMQLVIGGVPARS